MLYQQLAGCCAILLKFVLKVVESFLPHSRAESDKPHQSLLVILVLVWVGLHNIFFIFTRELSPTNRHRNQVIS